MIDCLQVINLVAFVHHFVKKKTGKSTLKQHAFIEGLAYDHANENIHLAPVLVLFVCRKYIGVQLAFHISFNEEGILGIKDLISQLGQKLFEKTPCVYSHLIYSVYVNKVNSKAPCCIEVWVLPISLKSVFKNELSANTKEDLMCMTVLGSLLLLQHVCEHFGADLKIVNPWNVFKGYRAQA